MSRHHLSSAACSEGVTAATQHSSMDATWQRLLQASSQEHAACSTLRASAARALALCCRAIAI
jgi:hypothetical protein